MTLAKMFADNPAVVGFDLRNEPHTPAGDTYAKGATWGTGDTATDVRLAYEQAGNAILAADPSALIFCEGISEFADASASGGFDSTWWGGDLQGVAQFPVVLSSAGHVVYSAHDYGPNLLQQAWMGWTYWALNGEDSYDLLDGNYDATPVSSLKQLMLAGIQFPLPGAGNGSPPPSSPPPASLSCAYSVVNSWSGGFQGQVTIANAGSGATSGWQASWTWPGTQQVSSGWSGVFTQSGANVTVTNEPYNGTIAPGSSVTVGFTATGAAPSTLAVAC